MNGRALAQGAITIVLLAGFVYAATQIADGWADWVVFGAFIFTFLGFAVAVNKRQYPTRKRSISRDADSNW